MADWLITEVARKLKRQEAALVTEDDLTTYKFEIRQTVNCLLRSGMAPSRLYEVGQLLPGERDELQYWIR
jgi:hypothetical protein